VRRALLLLTLLLAVAAAAGCGRELPEAEDEPVPTGGDPTGAFGEPGGGGAGEGRSVRLSGVPASVQLGRAASSGFKAEEPETKVVVAELDAAAAISALCAGKVEIAGTDREPTGPERQACLETQEGAVALHLADAGGEPVYLVTTQKALFDSLELEAYLDYVITNAEETARGAGLEPLEVDELQETQTRFEQGLAGVG
jgi:ABC-type phosphate transport system substrate-binding protein